METIRWASVRVQPMEIQPLAVVQHMETQEPAMETIRESVMELLDKLDHIADHQVMEIRRLVPVLVMAMEILAISEEERDMVMVSIRLFTVNSNTCIGVGSGASYGNGQQNIGGGGYPSGGI